MSMEHSSTLSLAGFGAPLLNKHSVLSCLHAVTSLRASHGCTHPDTITALRDLALAFIAKSRWCDALPLLEELLPLQTAVYGQCDADVIMTMVTLALALQVRTRTTHSHSPSPSSQFAVQHDGSRMTDATAMMSLAMRTAAHELGAQHALTLAATTAYGTMLMQMTGGCSEACDVLSRA